MMSRETDWPAGATGIACADTAIRPRPTANTDAASIFMGFSSVVLDSDERKHLTSDGGDANGASGDATDGAGASPSGGGANPNAADASGRAGASDGPSALLPA
jgi:hypothetical protein